MVDFLSSLRSLLPQLTADLLNLCLTSSPRPASPDSLPIPPALRLSFPARSSHQSFYLTWKPSLPNLFSADLNLPASTSKFCLNLIIWIWILPTKPDYSWRDITWNILLFCPSLAAGSTSPFLVSLCPTLPAVRASALHICWFHPSSWSSISLTSLQLHH